MRSRAAASVLNRAGFKEVYSLEGGIHAWNGLTTEGVPDTGWFSPAETPAQTLALAWLIEEGTRKFYSEITAGMDDPKTHGIFSRLAQEEANHQQILIALWPELTGSPDAPESPSEALENPPSGAILENGIFLADALQWCEGKSNREILEYSMGMETAAYDRYLRMFDEASGRGRTIFLKLSEEEKDHLRRLGAELDRLLG